MFYNGDRGPIWETIEAIDLAFDIGLPLHDTRQLDELAKGFYDNREEMITGKGASLKKLSPIVANRKKHSPAKKSQGLAKKYSLTKKIIDRNCYLKSI
jgi:hypothetical protein